MFQELFQRFPRSSSIVFCNNFSRDSSRSLTGDSSRDNFRFFLEIPLGITPEIPSGTYRGISKKTGGFSKKKSRGEIPIRFDGIPGGIHG